MRTIVGPMVCHDCREPVWAVRRTIAYSCSAHGGICTSPSMAVTIANEDGTTHLHLTGEQAFYTMVAQEAPRSSGVSHRVSCHGDSGPVTRPADRGRVASEV